MSKSFLFKNYHVVWQRLEEENQEFFQFYYIRLALKEQIIRFNELLKKQAGFMEQIQSTGATHMGGSNGSHMAQCKFDYKATSVVHSVI